MIPKSELTQNINGVITIKSKCKTYPVFVGKTRIADTQNYALTCDAYEDFTAMTTLNVTTNTGKIEVKKVDAENSVPIEGVMFQLLKMDGTQIATAKTNAQGIATFSGLYQGNYQLREIVTGENYILNSEVFDITVEYNKTTTKTVANDPKKGNLKINKTDSETSSPISGVTFELRDLNGNMVASGTTDENGELTFPNLRIGKYQLKETATNANYILNTTAFEVEIEYNKTTEKNITNDYKKGNIKVSKTDSETFQGIEGVTFELLDLNGNMVASGTTDANGELIFSNLRIGKYQLKETATKPNYILNTNVFEVEVEYNKTTVQNITNEYKRGNLIVNKVDKDNHKIPLGNVIFDLFSYEFNRVVGTYTTDVNGEFTINNLRIGEYRLIEKNTGKWYELAENTKVNIAWNETTETLVENELKKGQVKVIKVDEENNEIRIPDVKFEILDNNNKVLETIVTDSNGEALTSKYPIRDYKVIKIHEIETNQWYVLNDEAKTVELEDNQITEVTFTNQKKKGKIEITKISADDNQLTGEKKGTLLEGAGFEIYTENDVLIDTITTGKDGKGTSKLLECGNYYIKEKNSGSNYYLLNTDKYEVEIKENEETVPITIENTSVKVPKKLPKTGF